MYKSVLKKRIAELLDNHSKITFTALCKQCHGAFPYLVFSLLNQKQKAALFEIQDVIEVNKQERALPAENPSNYDWRFTKKTCASLSEKIKGKNYKIALFGTPALYLELLKNGENVHLFDVNDLLKNHLPKSGNIHIVDLNTHHFDTENEFDCVFMDPPWYNEYYEKWISQANAITKIGGCIYTSLFQELLRPEATKERLEIISRCNLMGHVAIMENFLNYTTPSFEKEVFDYYNIPIDRNWRMADLVKIRNEKKLTKLEHSPVGDSWIRFEINEVSISLRIQTSTERIKIKNPYKNGDNLLKTISLRNEIKKKVNLITSKNRGYVVSGNKRLAAVLREVEKGHPLNDIFKNNNLDKEEKLHVSTLLKTLTL